MKSKLKLIIFIVIVVAAIAEIIVIKQKKANEAKVPHNDPYLVGNTAGNIYNRGLFAESNGKVYFANPYDGYKLYVMNPDQSNCKKLADGTASYLNVLNSYIYYYTSTPGENSGLGYVRNGRGLFRTSTDGKKTFSLTKAESDSLIAVGDNIYFTDYEADEANDRAIVTVHKTTTSNKGNDEIIDQHIKLGGYNNGELYYGGINGNHYLYAYDTINDDIRVVADINVYLPIVEGDKVYYLDLDDNYKLKVYSLSDGSIQVLTEDRVDTYNLYDSVIFYQTVEKNNYQLKRIYTDGTGEETIRNGVFKDINITSTYTYFTEFGSDYPVYQIETFGYGNVTTFDAAKKAAFKK